MITFTDEHGQFAVKGGHFLAEDPAYFDAPFFSTTRSEVLSMDPQQRLVLENVYQALENGKDFTYWQYCELPMANILRPCE